MTYTIKMCAIYGGTLHSCLDCIYALDPIGCRLFRTHSHGVVYQKIDRDVAELAIKDYLGAETMRDWNELPANAQAVAVIESCIDYL